MKALLVPVVLLSFAASAAERTPVLVELFTSEGCSSCPPADEALLTLGREQPVPGAEIVPLELHVDYWDQQGWVDPFSLPEATARQEQYAAAAAKAGYKAQVFTPQVVVDGTRSFVDSSPELVRGAVEKATALPTRPIRADLRPVPGGVDVELHVGPGEDRPAALWVVLTESGLSSRVTRGENAGKTLVHAPVVRHLEQVAAVPGAGWTGTVRLVFARTWRRQALTVVAFAQDRASGRVVAIGTAPVPPPAVSAEPTAAHN